MFFCLLFNSPPFSCEHPSLIPIQALPPCILLIGLYWFCPLCLSVVSQNHSASLCLSIGEGGLYSHPRYRRSFIATWQKTRNLFKSLQNRLSKNIKNLYLYVITWEMVWHCMVLSWNFSVQSFKASKVDKFHVWGRHRIPAEEGNGPRLYWISSDQGHDRVQECGMWI